MILCSAGGPPVNAKSNTKTEILEAYNALLLQAKEQKAADQKTVKKEAEGERTLNKQIISALEGKIREQEEQIKQLIHKADDSVAQVQKIAVKAIEGASGQRVFAERTKENVYSDSGLVSCIDKLEGLLQKTRCNELIRSNTVYLFLLVHQGICPGYELIDGAGCFGIIVGYAYT